MHSSRSRADFISRIRIPLVWVAFTLGTLSAISAQAEPQKVIIDTDIGDDVDDAFALALAVKSPELEILGVTTTFGDTATRARIVDRFLGEVGRTEIPVLAGHPTSAKTSMSQGRYALGGHWAKSSHSDAVEFILDQIRKYPGEVTLIGIGPLVNVGTAIDRNATTFRKLKRVVIMGGSIGADTAILDTTSTSRRRRSGTYGMMWRRRRSCLHLACHCMSCRSIRRS